MKNTFVGHGVDNALGFGESVLGFFFVACGNGFFDVFHSSTVFGAQRGVRSIEFGVLADAFAA